ncbi:3'(2'),5'-bisphosphate nucleotidase CysQ [uncultured Enterovirga sp.]|uniref:3'(2'),5'-bisphosphate nucleotidase CysQ family protein n=1 Tax=uncultured Enterovirga sp. TaxID=2026352 RepID=UPI0035CC1661
MSEQGSSTRDHDGVALVLAGIAAEAGRFLAGIDDRTAGRVTKPDGSSSTAADLDSEALILARLAAAFPGIPVVAEEGSATLAAAGLFFLVDPLDGTRDYLTGAGEYSVNIALVSGERPVAAALAVPPLGRVWAAGTRAVVAEARPDGEIGPWRPATVRACPPDGWVALGSRRHGDAETERCLAALPIARQVTASSAAKFCLIASGEADIYVRCGPTMEWDTAAGDHILTRAGGSVTGPDGRALTYGHADRGYLNGPFVALADPARAGDVKLPEVAINPRRARP